LTLKEWRKANKLSQVEAAIRIGCSFSTYRLWEAGAMKPSEENQKKIDAVLGGGADGVGKRSRTVT
jgi:transcriptional regulator with XRE-family HTH domain